MKIYTKCIVPAIMLLLLSACKKKENKQTEAKLPDIEKFQDTIKGERISLFHIKNEKGMKAALTNFGARLVSLIVEDNKGQQRDVVLGFDKASDYNNPKEPFFGAIVGPFANRIAQGEFELDGKKYDLPINDPPNTLHGGFEGLHFFVWTGKQLSDNSVEFSCELPDGKEGFPGNRKIKVTYSITPDNELTLSYSATTDQKTIINLSNHAYFNLNGEGKGTILNHQLQIFADEITPIDTVSIPTGELMNVKETPFDFTESKKIGKDIEKENDQLQRGKGYDHNFVLTEGQEDGLHKAAILAGDKSGIVMEILTDQPGLQFYSGNFMADNVTLKNGATDSFRTALCLEPQHFPDSPNQPSFPSTVLQAKDTFNSKSVYRFSIREIR